MINIKKTKEASGGFFFPTFMLILFLIIFAYEYNTQMIYYTQISVEDSIAISTLASSCINLYEYEDFDKTSYTIINECYNIFVESFKINMELDDNLLPLENSFASYLIAEPIIIKEYSYYCIKDGRVYKTTKNKTVNVDMGDIGDVKTPDGNIITEATIYVNLTIGLKNIFSNEVVYVDKCFTVDIVSE